MEMEQKMNNIIYTTKLRKHGKNSMVLNVPRNLHSKVKLGDTYQVTLTPLWDLIQDEISKKEEAGKKEQELREVISDKQSRTRED
jgi:hypothetical protein